MYSSSYNFQQIFGKKIWREETTWKTRARWEKNIKMHNTETECDSTGPWALTHMIINLTVPHNTRILWLVITDRSAPFCFCYSCCFQPHPISHNSSVSTFSKLQNGQLRKSNWIPPEARLFSHQMPTAALRPNQLPTQGIYISTSLEAKWLECEAEHSPPITSKINKVQTYISTPPCTLMTRYLLYSWTVRHIHTQQGHYQHMQPHHHWFNHALMNHNWLF